MSLRQAMQQNQIAAAAVAVIVIVISVVWIARGNRSASPRTDQMYFYDVGSGELFPAARAAQPPIDAPSGAGQGVQAFVYGCGSCEPDQLHIAYVMTYTEAAVAAMAQLTGNAQGDEPAEISPQLSQAIDTGTLVAVPQPSGELQCIGAHTNNGMTIMRRGGEQCAQGKAKPCFPK
jgi:hypothetical protein